MLKSQLITFAGYLVISLMAACTAGSTSERSAPTDVDIVIGDDTSTDSAERAGTEPPAVTLTIDGWEQTAGIGSYCWQQPAGPGICADAIGVPTDRDPLPTESTFLAEFDLQLDAPVERVQLSIFPAVEPVELEPDESEWLFWRPEPGQNFTLPPNQNPLIELTLEPGLYVFHLSANWPDYGDASYGFLVDIEGVFLEDTASFANDQNLSMDEAIRRMRYQDTIGEIQPLLMADLPETYGGLWVEHQPEYRIAIALTSGDIETIRPYLGEYEWANFVEVRTVGYTLEELQAAQAIASQAADSIQVQAITAVDIVKNRVELIVGNPDLFLADLAQAGIELPKSVVVLANDPDGELPDTNGGVLLEAITSDDRVIHLPVQPPSGASMMALMEGTLVEVNGCLRIEDGHYRAGWLVLWPFGADLRVTETQIEVINQSGSPVARVGERIRAGGGAVENTRGMAGIDEMIPGMPIDGCTGPYWVAAPLESMAEQTVPDIYFRPFSSGGQILTYLVKQSWPSPESEILRGELLLDDNSCLRLDDYLLILPPETFLQENPLRLVDQGMNEIAQIGDTIETTGAEKDSDDYRYFENKVRCSGPYWGVNQISAVE